MAGSSTLASYSLALSANTSVPTGTDVNQDPGALPANWVVLFALGAILTPFLVVLGGVTCVSLRRSIRRRRTRKLKSSIHGEEEEAVPPAGRTTGRTTSPATGGGGGASPERKASPGMSTTTSLETVVVIGEPLRTGLELRRGSLETVDMEAGGGGGQEQHGRDSPPAYRTTPLGTPPSAARGAV
ncbi:hypothetical protein JCM10908_005499 [Rhodotorula pacifica]|uniref:uncharacterized protein n=1 Tax=Rhodotorula pacifica TaxID=1495444 RepID=UPI0031738E2C